MFPTVLTSTTGPLAKTGETLGTVMTWLGDVITSLLNADGALSALWPFILIGFSVSILMLAIKVIRSFSWGI